MINDGRNKSGEMELFDRFEEVARSWISDVISARGWTDSLFLVFGHRGKKERGES